MSLLCLRCHTIAREEHEEAVAGCETCGEAVYVKTKHAGAVHDSLQRASIADKEAILNALDDVLGEDADIDGAVLLDADTLLADDEVWRITVVQRCADGTVRTLLLAEEPALAFLAHPLSPQA